MCGCRQLCVQPAGCCSSQWRCPARPAPFTGAIRAQAQQTGVPPCCARRWQFSAIQVRVAKCPMSLQALLICSAPAQWGYQTPWAPPSIIGQGPHGGEHLAACRHTCRCAAPLGGPRPDSSHWAAGSRVHGSSRRACGEHHKAGLACIRALSCTPISPRSNHHHHRPTPHGPHKSSHAG